jgi:hypothetical protein
MIILEKALVFDVEADYTHGLDLYSKYYKLESCAFIKVVNDKVVGELYTEDFEVMKETLEKAEAEGYTFVVYNAAYEVSVVRAQFGLRLTKVIDCMRLHQHATKRYGATRSLALQSAVEEHLHIPKYKDGHLQWLIDNGIAKTTKEAHAKVAQLPTRRLEAYNMDDTAFTLELTYFCINSLALEGYNWEFDHDLYTTDIKRNSDAYLRGITFDRHEALEGLKDLKGRQESITTRFYATYEAAIEQAVCNVTKEKSETAFKMRRAKAKNPDKIEYKEVPSVPFNINSGVHKSALVDVLGLNVVIFTEKGSYSFAKPHLFQYGALGEDLKSLSALNKPIGELEKCLAISEEDGRTHFLIKAGTTVTGRNTSSRF